MKLGIYGGTFNPPHLGHLTSARLALDALGLDELRFVPAALPPHKRLPPTPPGRRPGWRWWSWPPTACSCPAG
ncbi:MAG: nicotinate-nicotinamide nucleotide adenylyltransferase [Flavonifractor plautii]